MEARASIRDIDRALGMPYSDPDRIAKPFRQYRHSNRGDTVPNFAVLH